MLIEFNNHESKSAEATTTSSSSRRYATEHNTIVGLEDDFNTILDRLTAQKDELIIIPIVGMGGIGKTTLARKVYDDSYIRSRFDKHAWVTISEEYNERQMLLEVVSSTVESNQEMSIDLMEIVYKGRKGRKFLIVIDDIWSTEAWDQMQRIFPNDNNKSRILLTTRLNYVADYASQDFPPHGMSFLSFGDSWILFTKKLFSEDPYPPQLEEIGKHIVQKCLGLPLLIAMVARLLGEMEPTHDNWKRVEENLSSFFGTVPELCQAIHSLKSYSCLPQHLKACFLYVGGFPEDKEIHVSKLIRLWIGEQFVSGRSNKRLEVVAEEYLEELLDRSLILAGERKANGRMKTCKIHDLLRQLCIREAQIEKFAHVMNVNVPMFSQAINYELRVMLLLNSHRKPVYCERNGSGIISTIRSLVFTSINPFVIYKRPCSIISHFELLKVLDVSQIDYDFSDVILQLVHLRYDAANIDEAPSLAKLWNLQTIILRKIQGMTNLELLPEIWTKTEIRHLDIGCNICKYLLSIPLRLWRKS